MHRTQIPKRVKDMVWDMYIGTNIAQTTCLCCETNLITMSYFDCGHVISVTNGGSDEIDNLRPICHQCNLSMGTQHLYEFKKQYGFIGNTKTNTQKRQNKINKQLNSYQIPYKCPRCGYETPLKKCMKSHLYKKKPCPNTLNIDLNDTIREQILVDHIYHRSYQ